MDGWKEKKMKKKQMDGQMAKKYIKNKNDDIEKNINKYMDGWKD